VKELKAVLQIREATGSDLEALLEAERQAFGAEGPEIVALVKSLLIDPTAKPLLSLVALDNRRVIGHILFTSAWVVLKEKTPAALLAPLAVVPDRQNRGVGGELVTEGLKRLAEQGVKLVFVLGHPGYYPRYGFKPAGPLGFDAPYPITDREADAWMVRELSPGVIDGINGKVACADAINRPEYWRE